MGHVTAQAAAMRSLGQLATLSEPLSLRYRPIIAAVLQLPPAEANLPMPPLGPGPAAELRMDAPGVAAALSFTSSDQPVADHVQPMQLPGPSPELCNEMPGEADASQLPHVNPDQPMQPAEPTPSPCAKPPATAKELSEIAAPSASDNHMAHAGRHIDEVPAGSASTQTAAMCTADGASMLAMDRAARNAIVLTEVTICAVDPCCKAGLLCNGLTARVTAAANMGCICRRCMLPSAWWRLSPGRTATWRLPLPPGLMSHVRALADLHAHLEFGM